ncbi:hypothetical protein [Streptomyces sp. NBRC 110028]|uniref:hypothetical protein n=1 Tax=Streptomyces sp. NBRC 110028 TaxID=1621260 RepID=UPI00131E9DCD|nr:hypothetical protein [Streptomyces sp. NBRC 110028]
MNKHLVNIDPKNRLGLQEPAGKSAVQNSTDTASRESTLPQFAHQCITQRFIAPVLTGIDGPSYVFSAQTQAFHLAPETAKRLSQVNERRDEGDREVIDGLDFASQAKTGRPPSPRTQRAGCAR